MSMKHSKRGGARAGAGRKPAPRTEGKRLHTVYAWLTDAEHDTVTAALSATQRGEALVRESRKDNEEMADKFVYGWYHYADGTDREFRYPSNRSDDLKQDGAAITVEVKDGGKWNTRNGTVSWGGGNYTVTPR